MKCRIMRHFIRVYTVKIKKVFRQKIQYFITMDYRKFIVSNQKEESVIVIKGLKCLKP